MNNSKKPDLSYAETKAAADIEEYAWIGSEYGQGLSDELDRVMKINPYWRNMYHKYGRATACAELSFEKFKIEDAHKSRVQKAAEDAKHLMWRRELDLHVETRRAKGGGSYKKLWALDDEFLKDQTAKGRCVDEWIDQWGTTIKNTLSKLRSSEEWWRDECIRQEKKKRIEQQAEIDKLKAKEAAQKRQADTFAAAVTAAAEKMLQSILRDLVASGVLSHGK
jgi:hypothetical protein